MQQNFLIKEKLFGQHESFLKYCTESGKNFIGELDREDFIAYRAEYFATREQIEQIKKLLGFSEDDEEGNISAPSLSQQNILVRLDDSFQRYFCIDDVSPYENISIDELGFSTRVQNSLSANNITTLAELLKSSRQKLFALKDFGQASINSIISTLEKVFNASKNNATPIPMSNIEEERRALASEINSLPAEIKSKNVRQFLRALRVEFFETLPDNLTIAELPKYLLNGDLDSDIGELKFFVEELRFDVRTRAKKIVTALSTNEREFKIILCRTKGIPLNAAGKSFDLTCEKVRQIELKFLARFMRNCIAVKKIFYFLHALTDGKSSLTLDDMKKFMDIFAAEIIWFLAVKANLTSENFSFDEKINAFSFADAVALDEDDLLENLPDIMEEKFFEDVVANLAREKNCSPKSIKIKLLKNYSRSGKIFHRGRLTTDAKCAYILRERFPNGFKVSDDNFCARFNRYLQEIFGDELPLIQSAIYVKITKIGVLCDRGKYIHPDYVHVPPEIIERVRNFIDSSDRTAIFYKELFETLKDVFAGTQITNHYFLKGVLKLYGLPYTLCKNYFTKSAGINVDKEFIAFAAERGEISLRDIRENFSALADTNITFLLERCREVIRIGDGKFMHASRLNLQAADFAPIKKFIRKNCATPINSRVLFELFSGERFADFMERNEIYSHEKLFGVLQYMFGDEFNFSRPYISTGNIKNLSNKKFLLDLLEDLDEIKTDDLFGICEENGVHYVARVFLMENLRPEFIRVDETTLMRPEFAGVTDRKIAAVTENIKSAVKRNGGWLAAQTFENYDWLPSLEIPWNSFLLESVVSLSENAPPKLKFRTRETNVLTVIFLSEEFAGDDFQAFLLKVLSAEHKKEPFRSEEEIFSWLKEQGLCNKILPKFLRGRAFELLHEY